MSRRLRLGLFVGGAVGLGVLLVVAVAGLPHFGKDAGQYGRYINSVAAAQRHVTEAVGAVTFDYRAIDSLGEEAILFAAVASVAVVLREQRSELDEEMDEDTLKQQAAGGSDTSDTIRLVGIVLAPLVLLLGLYLIAHGVLSPGGGFQGGIVVAAAAALVYLVADVRTYRRDVPEPIVEPAEAIGLAGYIAIGIAGAVAGTAVLDNVLPLGTLGRLTSGGMMPLLSLTVGLEVASGTALVVGDFLEQVVRMQERRFLH